MEKSERLGDDPFIATIQWRAIKFANVPNQKSNRKVYGGNYRGCPVSHISFSSCISILRPYLSVLRFTAIAAHFQQSHANPFIKGPITS